MTRMLVLAAAAAALLALRKRSPESALRIGAALALALAASVLLGAAHRIAGVALAAFAIAAVLALSTRKQLTGGPTGAAHDAAEPGRTEMPAASRETLPERIRRALRQSD